MSSTSALPRTAAVFAESTLAETQSDWDGNATEIYVIEPNVESVSQAILESANIKPRQQAWHRKIYGLKSESTFTCSMYLHAKGTNAAEAAAATAAIQHTILKSAVGGLDLGYAEGLAGGTVSAPTLGSDPGVVAGDFGFFYDASAGTVELRRIESISTVTLTLLEDLSFTPDGGGADVMYAAIDIYPNEDAVENKADANHITLGWKVQGRDTEDVYELRGCKPTLGPIAITAGEPVMVELAHKMVDWVSTPSATTWTSTPSGEAPNVPGIGTTCTFRLGDFGGAMATTEVRGTITFTPSVEHNQIMGPNGTEGVHGYSGVFSDATLEVIVEYDADYDDEFDAKTLKHAMIQVGNTPTTAWGLYFPRLEYVAKPVRIDEGGVTSMRLMFRCLEDTASVSGLTGDDIDKRRAPWHLLFCA